MTVDFKEVAKASARMAWQVGVRAVGFGLGALVVNAVLLAFLGPEVKRFLPQGGGHALHAGGSGALMTLGILALRALPALLLVVLFLVGFPLAWFIAGKARGFQRGVQELVTRHGDVLLVGFLERLQGFARRLPEAPAPLAALPRYLAKLEDLPRGLRGLYRFLLRRTPFKVVVESLLAQGADRLDAAALSGAAQAALRHPEFQAALAPGGWALGGLAGVNLGAFILIKLFL